MIEPAQKAELLRYSGGEAIGSEPVIRPEALQYLQAAMAEAWSKRALDAVFIACAAWVSVIYCVTPLYRAMG